VPCWDRMADRIHTLALPPRRRVASCGRYACPARVQPDLEERQFVAFVAEICRSSRGREGLEMWAAKFLRTPPVEAAHLPDVRQGKPDEVLHSSGASGLHSRGAGLRFALHLRRIPKVGHQAPYAPSNASRRLPASRRSRLTTTPRGASDWPHRSPARRRNAHRVATILSSALPPCVPVPAGHCDHCLVMSVTSSGRLARPKLNPIARHVQDHSAAVPPARSSTTMRRSTVDQGPPTLRGDSTFTV